MGNKWLSEAQEAVNFYRSGRPFYGYPLPGTVGMCARAARAIFARVAGKPLPFAQRDANEDGRVTALDMESLEAKAGFAITGPNAYHTAAAGGKIAPGARIYFKENATGFDPGHVVTIVEVLGDPAKSLANVRVFENTTAGPPRGPGTTISSLSDVCGKQGSARVLAVGFYAGR